MADNNYQINEDAMEMGELRVRREIQASRERLERENAELRRQLAEAIAMLQRRRQQRVEAVQEMQPAAAG